MYSLVSVVINALAVEYEELKINYIIFLLQVSNHVFQIRANTEENVLQYAKNHFASKYFLILTRRNCSDEKSAWSNLMT